MDVRLEENSRRGYLNKDFELFHLKDQKNMAFEFHYHDFNKIIVFISGSVTYLIEGKAYKLKPWDILLVGSNEIHKPLIDPDGVYERIVIWVNTGFIVRHNNPGCNLLTCFELAQKQRQNLIRLGPGELLQLKSVLPQLEEACATNAFGSQILSNALFMQLIVFLNRRYLGLQRAGQQEDVEYDEQISAIINYINGNLTEDLSVERLASLFFLSKYYLMHRFKAQTGFTLHRYILQKRLMMANTFLKQGEPATEACARCGFGDYSSFVRAFKKMFGLAPKKHLKLLRQIESMYAARGHQ